MKSYTLNCIGIIIIIVGAILGLFLGITNKVVSQEYLTNLQLYPSLYKDLDPDYVFNFGLASIVWVTSFVFSFLTFIFATIIQHLQDIAYNVWYLNPENNSENRIK